jgi:uncharacterized protein (DUF2141 family)
MDHIGIIIVALIGFLSPNSHGDEEKAELVLEVHGKAECNGTVWYSLCSNKSEFEEERGGIVGSALMANGKMRAVLQGVPPGRYAIKLFVDKNKNDLLDQGVLGIPKEPYGFSNDAMGMFGPPSFDDAGFDLRPGQRHAQSINLRGS